MGDGEFRIAAQIGAKGYYGKVALKAEPAENNGIIRVDFDATNANRWNCGAAFGIEYVLEHISQRKLFPSGGRVFVSAIEGHEVDTNNTVIAYVTAIALLEALGIEPTRRPSFNQDAGIFEFPK